MWERFGRGESCPHKDNTAVSSPGLCGKQQLGGKGEGKQGKKINGVILDSLKLVKNSQQNQEELMLFTSPGINSR